MAFISRRAASSDTPGASRANTRRLLPDAVPRRGQRSSGAQISARVAQNGANLNSARHHADDDDTCGRRA